MKAIKLTLTAIITIYYLNTYSQNLDSISNAYSTYIGSSSADQGKKVKVDKDGFVYLGGFTLSSGFPVTTGAYCTTHHGDLDAYVAKIDLQANKIVWATFLGGSGTDYLNGMAVDEEGNVYVTGNTTSSDFPCTTGAYDTTYNGSTSSSSVNHGDLYVAKLNKDGSGLIYSTYLGGKESEVGEGLTIDKEGCVYVYTCTSSYDYPVTKGSYDTTYNGNGDLVITKLSKNGDKLEYSFFLGGSSGEGGMLEVDSKGNLIIVGSTSSEDFPVTEDALYKGLKGSDLFITIIDPSGKDILYSTYLGGSNGDSPLGTFLDENDNLYITGGTESSDFPFMDQAFQKEKNGSTDAFALKFNTNQKKVEYCTYFGGEDLEKASDISHSTDGNIVISGYTRSTKFPCSDNAFDKSFNGYGNLDRPWGGDLFISIFDSTLSELLYSTYLGGSGDDFWSKILIDKDDNLFIFGAIKSSDFPVTENAIDNTYNGGTQRGGDAVLIKFSLDDLMNYDQTKIDAKKKDKALKVFPNPTQNTLQIEYPDLIHKNVSCKIIGLSGKTVQVEKLTGNTIDISGIDKGIYILNLEVDSESLSQKFIIE